MHSPHEDASPPSPDFAHVRAPVVARHARRPAQHIGHERPVEAELGHDCSESAARGGQGEAASINTVDWGTRGKSQVQLQRPPTFPNSTPYPPHPHEGKLPLPSHTVNSSPLPSSLVVQRSPHDQLLVSSLPAAAAPAECRTRAARHGRHPLQQGVWGGKCGEGCKRRVALSPAPSMPPAPPTRPGMPPPPAPTTL